MTTRKTEAPVQRRNTGEDIAVRFLPESFDGEARTVDVVWSTGAKVRRYSWFREEYYDEELSLDPKHVRLGRLQAGAPLLNSHQQWDLSGVIGIVEPESVRLASNEGRATVRFSRNAEVEPILANVRDGIYRHISVGYRVYKFERTPPMKEGEVATYRAVDWEPFEVSLVPVGADAGAGVRDARLAPNHCDIIDVNRAAAPNEEVPMKGNTVKDPAEQRDQPANPPAQPAAPAVGAAATAEEQRVRAEAAKAERARIAELNAIARVAKVDDALLRQHVEAGTAAEEFRKLAFDELAKRSEEGGEVQTHARILRDEHETMRELAANAVMARCLPGAVKLEEGAREYRGLTLIELGRDLLQRRGFRVRGLGRFELAGAALGLIDGYRLQGGQGTSDLASILANVMNKTLRRQYEAAPKTFTPWARMATNPDFKTISRTLLSGAPSLLMVNPGGEYKRGAVTDGKETYQLATYGRTVAFDRQALINDDLSALTRLPQLMGQAAADLESDTVYAVLTANAALSDGTALFHANHGNLAGAGGAIAVATLEAGRAAMRLQKGLEGRLINLAPRFILVPASKEQTAYQYTSSQFVPAKSADVNEFRAGGRTALEPIVEPRLDASSTTAWYLAADPMQIDTVEYCYLEGNEGVYTESRVGFDVDGVELKVRHDFAAKALDHRGLYKNAGA